MWLIDYAQTHENKLITVTSESFPHLLGGAIEDFQSIMKDCNYWNDDRWVGNPKAKYTFESGSRIEFISVDTFGKAHGPRRDVLFVNECNNFSYNIVDQLITRTREIIWLDWNPTSEFWFYTELLPNRKDDIDFITLTYKDNEALDEIGIQEIESHKHNKNWWTVYGLGQLGKVEGRVFSGWQIIDEIPHEARLERYGLDFGYSNPTAIVAIYYHNGGYILDEIVYQRELSNRRIADILNNLETKALVIGDSADPKSIDELKGYGVNIIPAQKGQDSVEQGVQFLQDKRISVTKHSVNLIREYRNLLHKVDKKTGKFIAGEYVGDRHALDATRYGMEGIGKTTIITDSVLKRIKEIGKRKSLGISR